MPSKRKSAKETSQSTPTSPPGDRLKLVDRTKKPGPDAFQFIGLERPGTGAVHGDGPVDRTGAGSRASEVGGRGAKDEAAEPRSGTARTESSEAAAAHLGAHGRA